MIFTANFIMIIIAVCQARTAPPDFSGHHPWNAGRFGEPDGQTVFKQPLKGCLARVGGSFLLKVVRAGLAWGLCGKPHRSCEVDVDV